MTREEAIKSLQNIIEYWTYKPTEVEAAKMAIAALRPVSREQVERVWPGCEACKDAGLAIGEVVPIQVWRQVGAGLGKLGVSKLDTNGG